MAEIHHFTYGWITPALAYVLSVLGSVLGLTCAVHARRSLSAGGRAGWLILAAFAIGGTAIWTMHFMAMLGFGVIGTDIRYDVPMTAFSALVAVVVVGVGLFIVGMGGTGRPPAWKIVTGGVLAGLGVNAMHYLGMAAMRLDGEVHYDPALVAASILIAVVAATVALWLSVTVRNSLAIFGSGLVMALAVNGMHFTGMAAMSVRPFEPDERSGVVTGAPSSALIIPIVLAVIFVVVGLIYAVLAAPTDEDRAAAAFLDARLDRRADEPAPAPEPSSLFGASQRAASQRAEPRRDAPRRPEPLRTQRRRGPTPPEPVRTQPSLAEQLRATDMGSDAPDPDPVGPAPAPPPSVPSPPVRPGPALAEPARGEPARAEPVRVEPPRAEVKRPDSRADALRAYTRRR